MAEDDDNDNDNDAGVDGGAGAGGRGFTSHRELSKVQSVVEIAEEWLSRVREALAQSTALRAQKLRNRLARHQQTAASSNSNEAAASASTSSDPQAIGEGGNDEGEGQGEGEGDDAVDPLEDLQDLLKESDEMPVYMEEAALLRTHLLALEWANKAALVLPLHATAASSEEGTQEGQDPSDGAMVVVQQQQQQQQQQPPPQRLPRLVEVQRLAKEIKRIRSTAITQQQQQQQGAGGSKAADDWERGMSLELPEEGNNHNDHHNI